MDLGDLLLIAARWVHFVAGITWIGLLYFFNLVNVPLMKELDAPTKGKVVPALMTRALWWFRWSALVTVLVGFAYYVYFVTIAGVSHAFLGIWLVLSLVMYAAIYAALNVPALRKDGRVLAVVVTVLAVAFLFIVLKLHRMYPPDGGGTDSHVLGIGIGGGYGLWMLLNVWGIIWRNQKKIIAWTRENAASGAAIPPEAAGLARHAFLASRTNAWLSLPMLFFMGAAAHPVPGMF